jgi:nicotinate-nucleotide pyrophosphorylase (carboxylating)
MNILKLKSMLEQFFIEDIGERDLSSELLFSKKEVGEVVFIAKATGVFCGKNVFETGFHVLDSAVDAVCFVHDGEEVESGMVLAAASGPVQSLLKGERVILNLLQRMSGIATMTAAAVREAAGTKARICDTRKTIPGLRMLDQYAVRAGGGFNHRGGLYDAVMLKDNHLAFAGTIKHAVETVKAKLGHTVKIEVEIETFEQLQEAIEAQADIVMFDNRTPDEIKDWITYVPTKIITEASGSITIENLHQYAASGVQYISLGSLTHSVNAFDISVEAAKQVSMS